MNPEEFPFMFSDWLPDQPDTEGMLEVRNVIPEAQSYAQLRSLTSFTDALTGACLGAFSFQSKNGNYHFFAGDATKLYKLGSGGSAWDDVSRLSGGAYTASRWEFDALNDIVIAADLVDDLQSYEVGIDSDFSAISGAPKAKTLGVVGDFVVLGDVNDGTSRPTRIQWSGYNNSALWTPSLSTQSGFRDLPEGGIVQRIVPGAVGMIVQVDSIRRIVYRGPPRIWDTDVVERERGTLAPDSVCWVGGQMYWLAQDGFQRMNIGGGGREPIGAERIDRWFRNNSSNSDLSSVRGAVDRVNRLIVWAFKSSSGSPQNDRVLIFNYITNRWAYAQIDTQMLSDFISTGYTLDELATILTNGIDTDSFPVDSEIYKGGGAPVLMAFDTSNKAATFAGTPLQAVFETGDVGDGRNRMNLNKVRPLLQGSPSQMTLRVGTRDKLNESIAFADPLTEDTLGEFDARTRGRFTRLQLTVDGGFDNATGLIGYGRRGARK